MMEPLEVSRFAHKYRGPIAAGLVLFAATLGWAWAQKRATEQRELSQLQRYADGLAKGLSILVERLGPERPELAEELRREMERHLQLRPPILFVRVTLDGAVVAEVHASSAGRDEPPPPEAVMIELPLLDDLRPPERLEAPWDWRAPRSAAPPLAVVVGLDRRIKPRALREAITRIVAVSIVAWLGIATLVFAWSRSIRSRDLAAALDAERTERERLAELSLAAAGLAHETKNPLGVILGVAQRLRDAPGTAPVAREAAEQVMDAADRATARLSDFIHFARLPTPKLAVTPASKILEHVTSILRGDFDAAGVRLALALDDVSVRCDGGMFEQVVTNLLLNALQASVAGSTTTLRLTRDRGRATLSVTDEGRGIPPELRPDIFRPYVSGTRGGHGLGLAIVKRIVEQHGWTIDVASLPRGTAFTIGGLEVVAPEVHR